MFKYMILIAGILGQVCGSGDGDSGGGEGQTVPIGQYISDQNRHGIIKNNTNTISLQYSVINQQNRPADIGLKLTLDISTKHTPIYKNIILSKHAEENESFGHYFVQFMYESYAKAAGVKDSEFSKVLDAILEIINKIIGNKNILEKYKQDFFRGILNYFNGVYEFKGFKFRSSFRQLFKTEWGKKITEIKNTIQKYNKAQAISFTGVVP